MHCTINRIQVLTEEKMPTDLPEGLQAWEGSSSAVEQGKHWSSTLIWLGVGIIGSATIWGFTAKVDQTISVRGKLEPSGSVREIDSPSTGVVSNVLVKEGELVEQGDSLINIEAEGILSRKEAVQTTIILLETQNNVLNEILSDGRNGMSNKALEGPTSPDPSLKWKIAAALQQTEQIKAKLKPKKRSGISADLLDTANTYDDKVALVRMIVTDEAGRVANVFKQMMRDDLELLR